MRIEITHKTKIPDELIIKVLKPAPIPKNRGVYTYSKGIRNKIIEKRKKDLTND